MDSLFSGMYGLTLPDFEPVVFLLDLLFRSALLLILFNWCVHGFRSFLTAGALHIALAVLLVYLASMSFLPELISRLFVGETPASVITLLLPNPPIVSTGSLGIDVDITTILLLAYLLGALACLLVLMFSLRELSLLRKNADFNLDQENQEFLVAASQALGVRKSVRLGISPDIESPVSFGCFSPIILVPQSWQSWDVAFRSTVLKHELAHVRRSDWITSVIASAISCLYWFNPVMWHVRKQMAVESENACDLLVLENGSCRLEYAEHLLWIARRAGKSIQSVGLSNAIVATTNLTSRIDAILAYKRDTARSQAGSGLLLLILSLVLLLPVSVRMVSAEDVSTIREPRLVYSPSPVYHPLDTWHSLQGHARIRFDVDANGNVDPDSIRVVSSTNREQFAKPAIEAVKQFRYEPRYVNGIPKSARDLEWAFSVRGYEASVK